MSARQGSRPLPLLPGQEQHELSRRLYNTYRHWLETEGRACFPGGLAPQLTVEYVSTAAHGIVCQLLYIPKAVPFGEYEEVVKGFHPGCKLQRQRNEEEGTETVKIMIPFLALEEVHPLQSPQQQQQQTSQGHASRFGNFLVGLLDEPKFVIALSLIITLSASYNTEWTSWTALGEALQ
jgi:hypothetical protein